MSTKADIKTKAPTPEPGPEGKDHSVGVEIDEDQEWIGELLAERVRQADAGALKSISVEELSERLEKLRREKSYRP